MKDGLYIVYHGGMTAAFVIRAGEVTECAPILRKEIEYWKTKATWYPTDLSTPPPAEEFTV